MPTRRHLSLLALIVVTWSGVGAAEQRQFGARVGASVATLEREQTQAGQDPFESRAGLTVGAFLLVPVRDRIALQLEMLFTEKGASVPLHDPSVVQGSLTTRYQLHYLDLPALVRVRGPRVRAATLNAFAGPTVSFRLSAKQQMVFELPNPAGFERDIGDEASHVDFGLTVGGGVEFGRVLLDGRYTWGLTDVLVENDGAALTNRGLLITAGVRIF